MPVDEESHLPKMNVAAVVAAGGLGLRFRSYFSDARVGAIAKQFADLAGKPLYLWSLMRLARHPRIDRVVLVVPRDELTAIKRQIEAIRQELPESIIIDVTAGGATRQESVRSGLVFLGDGDRRPDFVLVHDAARPLIDDVLIDAVIDGVIRYHACVPAIPAVETIKRVSDGYVVETLDRAELYAVQTPQAAVYEALTNAHHRAVQYGWAVTDDASLLEMDGHKVFVVQGSPYNLKVTEPLDLLICEVLLSRLAC